MDTRNYRWVRTFEIETGPISTSVTKTTKPTSTQTSPSIKSDNIEFKSELAKMKIIIASVVGVVGTAIVMICGFLIYRWNKKRKEQRPFLFPVQPLSTIIMNVI